MSRVTRSCFILAVVFAATRPGIAAAQQDFEGAVTSTMNMGGMMTVEVVSYTKAGKVRQEMSMMGQDVVSIFDIKSGIALTLMPQQKMFMKMDLHSMGKEIDPDEIKPKFTAIGTKETIVGHSCDNYRIEMMTNMSMELCVAKDLGFYMGNVNTQTGEMGDAGMQAFNDLVRKTFKDGFFPLKMAMSAQGTTFSTVVTKIERQSVSDDKFKVDVPEGYTEMKMPGRSGGPGASRQGSN